MHHADTGLQCVKGRIKGDFFTVDEDVAAVAAGFPNDVHTEKDLHQRGFARAVFACQAQNLTSLQGEVDVRQDLVAEEVFLMPRISNRGAVLLSINDTLPNKRGGGSPLLPVLNEREKTLLISR